MLETLRITNFALIDQLTVDFRPGLNIFTGSTGAGKTIIIDALGLALGERASEEAIRTGESKAVIEAMFKIDKRLRLPDETGSDDGGLLIRREINRDGRSRAVVNDRQVTLQYLRTLGSAIAATTGQHEQKGLIDPSTHRKIIDDFAGLGPMLTELSRIYSEYIRLRQELDSLRTKRADAIAERELLEFQVSEIESALLSAGEDENLEREKLALANAEQVKEICRLCREGLFEDSGSAIDRIKLAAKEMSRAARFVSKGEKIRERLEEQAAGLDDISRLIDDLDSAQEHDPLRLEIVEERITLIKRLKRKYGDSIEAIREFCDQARTRLAGLENEGGREKSLAEHAEKTRQMMSEMAGNISALRRDTASKIEKEVVKHLADLAMQGASFKVDFQVKEDPLGPFELDGRLLSGDETGFDRIEFLVCANPGEGLKPLASTASGGELSRILLALCSAFTNVYPTPTLVFDEIDAGISGEVASQVGKKLQALAKSHQVVCVTHLQQIASRGQTHYKIYKGKIKGRAVTRAKLLEGDERLAEIARLLAGEKVSQIALEGAAQLLKEGDQ